MSFNVSFDLAALVFLCVLFYRFFSQPQFPTRAYQCFKYLMILAGLNIIFDILGTVSCNYVRKVPIVIPYVLNFIYFLLEIALPTALIIYLLAILAGKKGDDHKKYFLYALPMLFCEAVLIFTAPFGGVFKITVEEGYQRGPVNFITYVCFACYIVMFIVVFRKNKEDIEKEVRNAFIGLFTFIIIAVGLQFVFPGLIMTGTAFTVSLYIMYFAIQNPAFQFDPKTGVFNFNAFQTIAREMMSLKVRMRIAVVDVHGLRRVNTLYGLSAGNEILRNIVTYLSDIENGWLCRISDTRFAIITNNQNSYIKFIEKVVDRQEHNWPIDSRPGETACMSMSLCHITHAESLDNVEMLVNIIEKAMMEKDTSNKTDCIYAVDKEAKDSLERASRLEASIREDLTSGKHFTMYYQLIYNCEKKRFAGTEALLRYIHPDLGFVSPGEFIPIVDNIHATELMDEMVIKKVFKDIAMGHFDDLKLDHIHINLSAASLVSATMISKIIRLTEEMKIQAEKISFEITETMAAVSKNDFESFMTQLKKFGFQFSLDDFGTGYSNVARLIRLPFDTVKLDRSLLADSRELYFELVTMIKNLKLTIVSEGVETADQADFVENAGVSDIQGFYYSRPVPPEKLNTQTMLPSGQDIFA